MLNIVTKSDNEIILTAPVLVPGEKDCDYNRGELPLTKEQVKNIASAYKDYGFVEKNHTILKDKKTVGEPIRSWITKSPMTLKGIDGEAREYPSGTWLATLKVTDPTTIQEVKNGVYTGVSVTAVEREVAEQLKASMKESSAKLIKDFDDPVGFAISLAKKPCVKSATFCRLNKEKDNMEEKDIVSVVKSKFGLTPKLSFLIFVF